MGLSLRRIFDRSFWVFAALAAATGTACLLIAGPAAFQASFHEDLEIFLQVVP